MSEFAKLTNAWGNDNGVVMVGLVDGTYRAYIDPETISIETRNGFGNITQRQPLSHMPGISEKIFNARHKFLTFMEKK